MQAFAAMGVMGMLLAQDEVTFDPHRAKARGREKARGDMSEAREAYRLKAPPESYPEPEHEA